MFDPNTPHVTITLTDPQWMAVRSVMRKAVGVWDEITEVIKMFEGAYADGVNTARRTVPEENPD